MYTTTQLRTVQQNKQPKAHPPWSRLPGVDRSYKLRDAPSPPSAMSLQLSSSSSSSSSSSFSSMQFFKLPTPPLSDLSPTPNMTCANRTLSLCFLGLCSSSLSACTAGPPQLRHVSVMCNFSAGKSMFHSASLFFHRLTLHVMLLFTSASASLRVMFDVEDRAARGIPFSRHVLMALAVGKDPFDLHLSIFICPRSSPFSTFLSTTGDHAKLPIERHRHYRHVN
ncbi:hypothetical protein V8C26DRAFT_303520 [Trichoderma gracile]